MEYTELRKKGVYLGRAGEDGKRTVWLDVTAWNTAYDAGAGVLLFTNPAGRVWPMGAKTVTDDVTGTVTMEAPVTAAETALAGVGHIEAQWISGGEKVKSQTFNAMVLESGYTGENVPDNAPGWVADLITELNAAGTLLEELGEVASEAHAATARLDTVEAEAKAAVENAEKSADEAEDARDAAVAARDAAAASATTAGGYRNAAAASATAAATAAESAMSATPEGYADFVASAAAAYSSSSGYAVGDLVMHESTLYRCTTAIDDEGEDWDSDHWTETTAADEFARVHSAVSGVVTNTLGIKEYDPDNGVYKPGDLCIYGGNLYTNWIAVETPEAWAAGKWRTTTLDKEIAIAEGGTIPDRPVIDQDNDCVLFPIQFLQGRYDSNGKTEESGAVVYRRLTSRLFRTDEIDAVCLFGENNYNVNLTYYDSDFTVLKNFYVNGDVLETSDDGRKFIATHKSYAYVKVALIRVPDQAPNVFDRKEIANNVYGVKFLKTGKYNPETQRFETKLAAGFGNYISGGEETYNYQVYRLRTPFYETAKYQYILVPEADDDYTYTVNIRYLDENYVSRAAEDVQITTPGLHEIPRTRTRFAIQLYNSTDYNTVVMSPLHAMRNFKLITQFETTPTDIVRLNDIVKTTERLQQMSMDWQATSGALVQPLVLLHFSDLHRNATALSRVVDFARHYSSYIDDVIHTGDNVGSINSTHIFGDVSGAENFLNVIGNHDTWRGSAYQTYDGWHYLTEAQTYETYFEPFVENWGESLNISEGHCYYYKDYSAKNVRLIVLDCMHPTTDQLTWFVNTLAGAKTAGLHVVVADHVVMAVANAMTYLDESGFCNPMTPRTPNSVTVYPSYEDAAYSNAIADFVNGGGIIACWLCGHRHADTLAVYNNVLNIGVTTAGDLSSTRTVDARIANTKSYDAMNLVGIDTARGFVYISRIGLEYNCALGRMDTMCWDYINHRLVHTS